MGTVKKGKREFADEWQDSIGQTFRPGDLVAVATVNGRSPQMVIAEVKTINLTNAKGERYTKSVPSGEKEERRRENRRYIGPPLPEEPRRIGFYSPASRGAVDAYWAERRKLENDPANWETLEPTIWFVDKMVEVQTATVTAQPLIDGRGFYRSGVRSGEPAKAVTYQFLGNIVRLPEDVQAAVRETDTVHRRVEFPPNRK